MVVLAFALALAAIEVDDAISTGDLSRWPRLFGTSADGARAILQAISTAMITIAGLTFSITVLILSMGASQYTPRIIRTFMGNRPNQMVLGVFIGVFVYCLVVLRTIRGDENEFIPSISVTVAIVLAVIGVGVLVYFIHHIASSIQASAIADEVAAETMKMIDALFPNRLDQQAEGKGQPPCEDPSLQWFAIAATRTGYLQSVDYAGLEAYAHKYDLVVKMDKIAGDFITNGLPLASVSKAPDAAMARELSRLYTISHYRTVEQDIGVGIRQLVDIALKAMSPAMNDTTTAVMCIDYLSAIMIRLAPRCITPDVCMRNGRVTVFTKGASFDDFLLQTYAQIREHAGGNLAVYRRLLQTQTMLLTVSLDSGRRQAIARQIELTIQYANQDTVHADQRAAIGQDHMLALQALRAQPSKPATPCSADDEPRC